MLRCGQSRRLAIQRLETSEPYCGRSGFYNITPAIIWIIEIKSTYQDRVLYTKILWSTSDSSEAVWNRLGFLERGKEMSLGAEGGICPADFWKKICLSVYLWNTVSIIRH